MQSFGPSGEIITNTIERRLWSAADTLRANSRLASNERAAVLGPQNRECPGQTPQKASTGGKGDAS